MPSINGKTYTKIVTTGAEIWDIVPFDNFGNAVSEMVIEADTTLGALVLNLPAIFTFNNFWNTKITIVANTGLTNTVGIKANALANDTIGGQTDIILGADYKTIEMNVATNNTWYGVATN
jgi:hypothetical protein